MKTLDFKGLLVLLFFGNLDIDEPSLERAGRGVTIINIFSS